MNRKWWAYLFFACLLVQLAAIVADWTNARFITKPLLVAMLFAWFIQSSPKLLLLHYYIAAALFFSWCGDLLLLKESSSWFMAGLGSFLLAHCMYIAFFVRVRRQQLTVPHWNAWLVTGAVLYAVAFYIFLYPYIGELKIPVGIYAIAITCMLVSAAHAVKRHQQSIATWMIAGAFLFVLSDSLLATNRFYHKFPWGDAGVMFTYGLAQYAIIKGSLLYLAAEKNKGGNPVTVPRTI